MPKADPKHVVIEIIRKADRELCGKTRLFKAFYIAHLHYFNDNPGILTDWPIARMPQGPGIHESDKLLGSLVEEGYLQIEIAHEGPYPEYRYRLTEKADESPPLSEDANLAIQRAVDFVKSKSASELSRLTHEHSHSWIEGRNGDIMDIYVDVIPSDEYATREKSLRELETLEQELKGVFGE